MPSITAGVRKKNGELSLLVYEHTEYFWSATGTREQLIEAGLCTPAHFPEGRKRTIVRAYWSMTYQRGGRWKFNINRTREETARFRAAREARIAAVDLLDRMPTTPEHWRAHVAAGVDKGLDYVRRCLKEDWNDEAASGFSLSPEAMRALEVQFARIRLVLANAAVSFDASARQASIESLRQDFGEDCMPRLRAPLKLVA